MFQTLLEKCHEQNLYPDPEEVMIDFEIPVIKAVKNILGIDARGCFYHKRQCTWRKIQDLGLVTHHRETEEFRIFCGMIDALAFVPADRVIDGVNYLYSICPLAGEELLAYVDTTYIQGPYRPAQTGDLVFKMRRIPCISTLTLECSWANFK